MNRIYRILTLAAIAATLSLATLSAQTFEGLRVHFDQAVKLENTLLPAGDYTITMARSNGDIPLLRFSSNHGVNVIVLATREDRPSGGAERSEVLLDKSGSVERVTRIEVEGSASDFVIPAHH